MSIEIYSGLPAQQMLDQAVAHTSPIEFVMIEDILMNDARRRAPAWSPKLIMSPGGWRRYQQGQERIRFLEDYAHQSWMDMVKAVFDARTRLLTYQADAKLREMQWAEQLRQQNQSLAIQLDNQEKMLILQNRIDQLKEARAHTNSKEILEITHTFEKEILAIKTGQDDPVYKVQRFMAAMESSRPILEKFAHGDQTHQANRMIVTAILEGIRTIGR